MIWEKKVSLKRIRKGDTIGNFFFSMKDKNVIEKLHVYPIDLESKTSPFT